MITECNLEKLKKQALDEFEKSSKNISEWILKSENTVGKWYFDHEISNDNFKIDFDEFDRYLYIWLKNELIYYTKIHWFSRDLYYKIYLNLKNQLIAKKENDYKVFSCDNLCNILKKIK